MIWGAWNIPQAALLKLMILYPWEVCLRESLEVPKGSKDTCSVRSGSQGGYGANAREIGLISIWFWVHQAIFNSWGDISVLLVLWQCCWGLSGVQSSKSRLLTCLIGKTQLIWHSAGESGLISQRGEVSWVFSSCGRNLGYILELRRGCTFESGFCSVKWGHLSSYEGQLRNVN